MQHAFVVLPAPARACSFTFMADLRAAFSLADADAPPLAKGLDDKLSQAVTEAPILAPTSKKLHILGNRLNLKMTVRALVAFHIQGKRLGLSEK